MKRSAPPIARHVTLALALLAPSPLMATRDLPPGMTAQDLAGIQRRMREAGELGEGHASLGFDGRSGEFTSLAMDASATHWVTGRGTYGRSARTVTMSGTDYQPIIGHVQEYDFVMRFPDESTWVWEVWFKDEMHTRGGAPHKMVEITFHHRREVP